MKPFKNYNTNNTRRARFILILLMVVVALAGLVYKFAYAAIRAEAEESFVTCFVMCKPVEGNYVSIRRTPSRRSDEVGRLECGDWFETDSTDSDGWIRVYGIGEYGEGWIWCGYVATEEPQMIGKQYRVNSNGRVIIRKWMNGPKVDGKGYLVNGSTVQVFCIADGWAMTNRGYIMALYLEEDPE